MGEQPSLKGRRRGKETSGPPWFSYIGQHLKVTGFQGGAPMQYSVVVFLERKMDRTGHRTGHLERIKKHVVITRRI